ncbi:hypothetical protein COLO4_06449 [Corchorus olitorius]|uniref:Uncharacterized protein n=1 Tax=Corchorus olitorius TaxID=93759 RepID=A0A1R3KN04_9ROSI|nr:hypothetical protein COLO4_06449 [Corchorus olitorius]
MKQIFSNEVSKQIHAGEKYIRTKLGKAGAVGNSKGVHALENQSKVGIGISSRRQSKTQGRGSKYSQVMKSGEGHMIAKRAQGQCKGNGTKEKDYFINKKKFKYHQSHEKNNARASQSSKAG